MSRKRIAIACQGGGSQCAFVAGVLKMLFDRGVQDRYDVVGLSGTSGGALTAALAWMGLLKRALGDRTPIGDQVVACWKDLSAQTAQEVTLDKMTTAYLRLAERGFLPTWAVSPSSALFRLLSGATATMIGRPEFTDLRALLVRHIDFDALPGLVRPDSPVLLVGAGDVLDGTIKIFSSAKGEIKVESLLASAAVPNLFPAVWADGHAYWDGIFASNPPVFPFLRNGFMGAKSLPDEIWIVQINPVEIASVPRPLATPPTGATNSPAI